MATKAVSEHDLARLLREAEQAHGKYEQTLGHRDENWPNWYARFIYQNLAPLPDYAGDPEKMPSAEPYLSE